MFESIVDLILRVILLAVFSVHAYDYSQSDIIPNNFDVMLMVFMAGNLIDRKIKD